MRKLIAKIGLSLALLFGGVVLTGTATVVTQAVSAQTAHADSANWIGIAWYSTPCGRYMQAYWAGNGRERTAGFIHTSFGENLLYADRYTGPGYYHTYTGGFPTYASDAGGYWYNFTISYYGSLSYCP